MYIISVLSVRVFHAVAHAGWRLLRHDPIKPSQCESSQSFALQLLYRLSPTLPWPPQAYARVYTQWKCFPNRLCPLLPV